MAKKISRLPTREEAIAGMRRAHVEAASAKSKVKALFVELPEDDLKRYKELAEQMGLSMRNLVRLGLEQVWGQHTAARMDAAEAVSTERPVPSTVIQTPLGEQRTYASDLMGLRHAADQDARIAAIERRFANLNLEHMRLRDEYDAFVATVLTKVKL